MQRRRRRSPLFGGGTDGNEQLTATVGVVLIVLLAALGITILRIGQLISEHLFIGLLLLGPVALKLASTGYRFLRYYAGDPAYRRKGPPQPLLRMLAPFVVLTTVVVFASGIVLLAIGPAHRAHWVLIHKASFILWLGAMALHVLGHLVELPHSLRATRSPALHEARARAGLPRAPGGGGAGRAILLASSLVGGLVLAIALIPQFSAWTAAGAFGFGN